MKLREKKYSSSFVGKELMLSHETLLQNIERYSGKHGNLIVLEKLFLLYSTVFSIHTYCFLAAIFSKGVCFACL